MAVAVEAVVVAGMVEAAEEVTARADPGVVAHLSAAVVLSSPPAAREDRLPVEAHPSVEALVDSSKGLNQLRPPFSGKSAFQPLAHHDTC